MMKEVFIFHWLKQGIYEYDNSRKPLIQPFSIFSDCFAAIAFAQYYKATGCKLEWAKTKALTTFENIEKRKSNPMGKYGKGFPGTRDFSGLNVIYKYIL